MAVSQHDLPNTMMAATLVEFNQPWQVQNIPFPSLASLGDHDILIKVAVAGLCHTDLMVQEGKFGEGPKGLSGSHEPSGTVVALGTIAAQKFALNDRVIAIGIQGLCGDCMDCNGSNEDFKLSCKFTKGFTGISLPGAFQEYTIVDERFAVKIPDSMSFIAAAPLTCAGSTSWRAVKRANVKPGGWLGIVGSGGGLGHLAIQFAVKSGIHVIGVEARDVGLEMSQKAGATAVIDVRTGKLEEVVDQVRKAIGPRGTGRGDDLCDATIVLSEARSAIHTAMAMTKCHGTVIAVAQPERIDFPFEEMIFRDIRLMGSNLSSGAELADQVAFVEREGVKLETTVFHGLENLEKAREAAKSGTLAGKIVVVVDEKQI